MLADCPGSDIKYYQVLRTCNSPVPRVLEHNLQYHHLRNKTVAAGHQLFVHLH